MGSPHPLKQSLLESEIAAGSSEHEAGLAAPVVSQVFPQMPRAESLAAWIAPASGEYLLTAKVAQLSIASYSCQGG